MPKIKTPTKKICGRLYVQTMCNSCKLPVWTLPMGKLPAKHYICDTCGYPKDVGVGRGLDGPKLMDFDN